MRPLTYGICLLLMSTTLWAGEIHEAAAAGDLERVKALMASGTDVNEKNRYAATALNLAAGKGKVEVVRYLLSKGADPNVRDTFYKVTPLEWSMDSEDYEIVVLLLKHGASDVVVALRGGIEKSHEEIVKTALERGAIAKSDHLRATKLLSKHPHEAIARLLAAAKTKPDPDPIKLDGAKLKGLTGHFRLYKKDADEKIIESVIKDGKLTLVGIEDKPMVLEPLTEMRFRVTGKPGLQATFAGRAGTIEGLYVSDGAENTIYVADTKEEPKPEKSAALTVAEAEKKALSFSQWPSFRGSNANGINDNQNLPITWDVEKGTNIRWKTAIPGLGHSSPVVWDEHVFITTAISGVGNHDIKTGLYGDIDSVSDLSEHTWKVYCLNAKTGAVMWEHLADTKKPLAERHLKSSQANSTPATNGKYVIAVFPTAGMYCYTMDGKLQWHKDLGRLGTGWFYDPNQQWGFASSPIIYKNTVILQADVHEGAWIGAFDLETGRQVWKTERDEVPGWATPSLYMEGEQHELVTNGSKIRGYDPATGKQLWQLGPNSEVTIATPLISKDLFYVTAGYPPVKPIYAVRPGSRGDLTLPESETSSKAIAWSMNRGGAYMPTPLLYKGLFYIGRHNGRLSVFHAATGERVYRARIGKGGTFTGSPVASDNHLYFSTESGDVYVVEAGNEYKELAHNEMNEVLMTTPAIAGNTLYIRTRTEMVAIGN